MNLLGGRRIEQLAGKIDSSSCVEGGLRADRTNPATSHHVSQHIVAVSAADSLAVGLAASSHPALQCALSVRFHALHDSSHPFFRLVHYSTDILRTSEFFI